MKQKLLNKRSVSKTLLVMKMTIVLTLVLAIQVTAKVNSQDMKFNYSGEEVILEDVFSFIETNSEFRFFFPNEHVNLKQYVSVDVKNATIDELLEDVLKDQNLNYRIFDGNLIVIKAEQPNVIKGQVTDANGKPLPGVNILEVGTNNGTVTDIDGNYSISVSSDDAILRYSFVGYLTEEISVSGRTTIDLQMIEDVRTLDEVVVIGYGTQKKSDLTGAVVSVDENQLKQSLVTSVDQALQGRAAGVQVFQNSGQPGGGVSIRIRGASSISGSSEPLYVIDGVPFSGDSEGTAVGFDWAGGGNGQTAVSALATINPQDIVSIEILKDASATAIYGSRGANGVVLITTKRGKAGESKVSYDAYYGIQQPAKRLDVMNLREYADYQNDLVALDWIEEREELLDPSILGDGTDWQDEIFRNAGMQSHQLTVSGGNERTTYAVTGGYFQQDGIIVGSNFDRFSLRLNLDNQTKDWLKVGNSFALSRTNERITLNDSDDGVVTTTLLQAPNIPLKFPDGSWGGPTENNFGVTNPVAMALDRDLNVRRTRAIGNLYADLTFLKYFTLRSEVGTDIQFTNNYAFNPTYEYGTVINDQNQSRRNFDNSFFWIVKNYLTFNYTLANVHDIRAMVGQEAQESTWEGMQGIRKNFVSNDIQELNAGDATTATNSQYKGSSALASYFGRLNYTFNDKYLITGTIRADGSSKFGPENKWGYFPSFALGWKLSNEPFLQNLTFINNLKLRGGYGQTGNQDIGNYSYGSALAARISGVGQGYLLNNHPNPAVKWESTEQTNIGIDLGIFNNRIQLVADVYLKTTDDMLLQLPSPNYMGGGSWMGIGDPYVNLGSLENKGIEISLTTSNISQQDFNWTTNLNFSLNRNEVLSLGQEGFVIYEVVQWFNTVTKTEVGHPIGQFYGYVTNGVFENYEDIINHPVQSGSIERAAGTWPGDLRFKNIDETSTTDNPYAGLGSSNQVIDDLDRTFIGDPNPDFTYGMNNTFNFKNIDASIYLQGVYGNELYNFTRSRTESMRNLYLNQLKTVDDRARVEMIDPEGNEEDPQNYRVTNPGTDMPRAVPTDPNQNTRVSDRYIEDGTYLRIKNISVGYTLPTQVVSKFQASRLRLYVNIQNLYTFTEYSGFDPEIGSYNQNPLLTGVDNGRYPTPRVFTFGINLDF